MSEEPIASAITPADAAALPEAHAEAHEVDHHNDPEHILKEMKVYVAVFCGLAALTALTVWACYGLKLPVHTAIAVAVAIACTKGFLVAGFFMHLLSEKRVIYGILALTVAFFIVLLTLPVNDVLGKFGH